ncbi:hypothetical protein [Arthrobacter sp. GMC3]|uniref:hypothetical protein n=1 Tax=Arthrobacter sp. GMC3 TaxID=2058894 RepID=UPI0015E2D454|nr:hypothetical protein [Arthrobacter sp. GMC3]
MEKVLLDHVVEVSFVLPEAREMRWISWASESGGPLNGVPSGNNRLRLSAKGRDQRRND